MGALEFSDDLIELFSEEQLTVAAGECGLYIENRVPPVEEADDEEEGMGDQQDPVGEVIRVPKADDLLSADLRGKGLHRPEFRTIHAMSPMLVS
jgi:hypothetical protein